MPRPNLSAGALAVLAVIVLGAAGLWYRSCGERQRDARITAWLFCIECNHGELEAVVRMRGKAVEPLATTLFAGRGGQRHANKEAQFRASYVSRPDLPESTYVATMMAGYVAGYQERTIDALRVLADSGVADARATILDAMDSVSAGTLAVRDDVRARLEEAAIRTDTVTVLWQDTVAYGDTVVVARQMSPPWNTAALSVVLTGSPFSRDLFVQRTPDTVRLLAIASVGTRWLTLADTASSHREVGILRINRLRYRMHDTTTAESLPSGVAHRRFPPLRPGHDFFRLMRDQAEPSVHVAVAWAQPVQVRLDFQGCGPGMPVGSPLDSVWGTVTGPAGEIAGASVRDSQSGRETTTDSTGRFALDSIPANELAVIRVTAPGHTPLTFVARPELRLAYHLRLADAQETHPVRQVFIPAVPVGNTIVGGCEYVDLGLLPDPPPHGPVITRLLVVPGSRPPVSATIP